MSEAVLALLVALAMDLTLGEPPNALHPVVWMGNAISASVKIAPKEGASAQFVAGVLMAIAIPSSFAALGAVALLAPWPALHFVATVYLLKSTFALRGLGRAAFVVRDALARGGSDGLAGGREALRSLCSRDPSALSEAQLVAATIESVAENASDSFVAPLFWFAIFGVPGALFYRAVNTLDAMIGYRGKYEYLGKASARLDDALNLVPARITAALLLLAAPLARADAARMGTAWRIFRRDAARTESPNAGRPMAAMAGILRVELAKDGCYRLGDPSEALALPKIDSAWRVVCAAAAIATLVTCAALEIAHVIH